MGADDKKKPRKRQPKPKPKEPLTEAQKTLLAECGEAISDAIASMEQAGQVSREFSIVKTKLEEAEMWIERGFSVLGYEVEDDDEDEDDAEDEGEEE